MGGGGTAAHGGEGGGRGGGGGGGEVGHGCWLLMLVGRTGTGSGAVEGGFR